VAAPGHAALYSRNGNDLSAKYPTKVPNAANTIWVKPKLVAEVKFTEWTKGGEMRHPVYLGLRTDKPASQVVREVAKPIKRGASAA